MYYDPLTLGYAMLFIVIMSVLMLLPLLLDSRGGGSYTSYSSTSNTYGYNYERIRYIYHFPSGRVYVKEES